MFSQLTTANIAVIVLAVFSVCTANPRPYVADRQMKDHEVRERSTENIDFSQIQLNATQSIVNIPLSSSRADIPSGQPNKCPNYNVDRWWPGQKDNLRSTCPWVYVEKDLGMHAYPRYIYAAQCLCYSCINSTNLRCLEIKQTFTYSIIQSQQNRMALVNKVNTTITVGCHCTDAMPHIIPFTIAEGETPTHTVDNKFQTPLVTQRVTPTNTP